MTETGHRIIPIKNTIEVIEHYGGAKQLAIRVDAMVIDDPNIETHQFYEFWLNGGTEQIVTNRTSYLLSEDGQTIESYRVKLVNDVIDPSDNRASGNISINK